MAVVAVVVVVVGGVVSVVVVAAAVVVVVVTGALVVVVTGGSVVVTGGSVVVTGGWVVVAGGWVVVTGVESGVVPGVADAGRVVAVGAAVAVGPVPRFGDVVGDELAAVTGRGAAIAALDGADVLGGDAFAWPPCDWSTICRISAAICAAVGRVDDVAADCSGLWLGGKATAALGAVVVGEDAAPCRGVEELLNANPSGMPIKMTSPATAR